MSRMFVAVVPPLPVKEDLAEFLQPRAEHPWIDADQWHVTLAFLADVQDARLDDLIDGLTAAGAKRKPFGLQLSGAGAFPDPSRAKVLWMDPTGMPGDLAELDRLAANTRAAAAHSGAAPDGRTFRRHLSVSRLSRPSQQMRWVQVLDTYRGPCWQVEDFELIRSYLGEGPHGRPRYETVGTFPLGVSGPAAQT
ncbi:RNA 2',3'-cyclic phosphodiesterase [Rudaeicoccus suwonensis]|nr:RNA 2',3'-cyclic phosphodiesterase [Rudaeicoccus suwonensis]